MRDWEPAGNSWELGPPHRRCMSLSLRFLKLAGAAGVFSLLLQGQVCRLSVAGLNQSRKVMGPVDAECSNEIVHTAPFGNWGVTSNYGQKGDSHQFEGWCHNTDSCTSSLYEWNSCTERLAFKPPNCSLYNSDDCTHQVTTTGINVHGTKSVDIPVRCPTVSAGDRIEGGCEDLRGYASGTNFMSLYELDPGTSDDLVQTLYFPETLTGLACDAWGCAPAMSSWVSPSAYDSPKTPAKVFAELATVVNWGAFVDTSHTCGVFRPAVSFVSAASYAGPALAPDSIASGFAPGIAPITAAAETGPLPTSLGGVSLRLTDSANKAHSVPLFFVSPAQINFEVPAGAAAGPATISVFRGPQLMFSGSTLISATAPAIFTANSDGRGVAAAIAVHAKPDGSQSWQYVFDPEVAYGSRAPAPIRMGLADETAFLLLFGTGIRGCRQLSSVRATIAGIPAVVEYAGPQSDFAGLDQVNIRIPRDLPNGEAEVVLTVEGQRANIVTVSIAR
jgi:uncharacterized protein (TIGR03437 family)